MSERTTPPILGFFGEHRFLSNFFECVVEFEGDFYTSTEHAYVAAKTTDVELRKEIKECITPGQVKRLGRTLTLRSDWEQIKFQVMESLLRKKFAQDPFKTLLLETGDAYLEETNTWGDVIWGVCDGKGENNLGKILMKIRSDLMEDR